MAVAIVTEVTGEGITVVQGDVDNAVAERTLAFDDPSIIGYGTVPDSSPYAVGTERTGTFAYLAHAFDLTIAAAIEEESGSEASAKELIELIELVQSHGVPAIFAEVNGSVSAPGIISRETGVSVHQLNMGMEGNYFEIMRYNIDTLKEALG